jgi:adenylylsulfate kinase
VKTIWINCDIETLIKRDTKQLYRKAMLPDDDPGKVKNLTGINDPYEAPQNPDLIIDTHLESERGSIEILYSFILKNLPVLFSIVPLLDMLMAD